MELQIMEQRHMFIYGYENEARTNLLKDIEKAYPVIADSDKPIALYFDNLGLPVKSTLSPKDAIISRDYLHSVIAERLIEKTLESKQECISKMVTALNKVTYMDYKNVYELLNGLKQAKECYLEEYMYGKVNKIVKPYVDMAFFIKYKEMMGINSYIAVIYDKKNPISISSTKAINDLISSRINKVMSLKIAIEPGNWPVYYNTFGDAVEYVHDYGTVELDDAQKEHVKKLKRNLSED